MGGIDHFGRAAGALLTSVVVVACSGSGAASPGPTQPPASSPASSAAASAAATTGPTKSIVVGFTVSQTGSANVESVRQQHGLELWMDDVNKAGGIRLADGSMAKPSAKSYDDESNKDRIQQLYTKLINEDKSDFLISPYSSGLADAAAVIAEQNSKLMVTAGAASDGTYQKGYSLVFQTYTPASRYLTGAVDLLILLDSSAKKLAIVHENDKFSSDVATALTTYAGQKSLQIVVNDGYASGATDFASFVNKITAAAPDAVMGGGHFADTSTFAKQLYEKGIKAKMIALLVAPPEPKFADIGPGALGVIGPSQWEPTAKFTEDAAKAAKLQWLGPSVAEFTSRYKAKFNEDPSYHSAGGYAAGLILQAAIQAAGSTDTAKVKAAMDGLDLLTFYGRIKFDTTPQNHGLQLAHEMVWIQWQGSSSSMQKEVVWPTDAKTASATYPLR